MIEFKPYDITSSDITTSALIGYDSTFFGAAWQGEWAAGSYSNGDIVYKGVKLYESTKDSNTDDPEVGVVAEIPSWIDRGYVNTMRMFDTYVGTDQLAKTEATSPLTVTISKDEVEHIGLFNVVADVLTIEILDTDDISVWSKTYNLLDDALAISDWYEYFYEPYPPAEHDIVTELYYAINTTLGEKIKITMSSDGDTVSCSNCFVGFASESGKTKWEPKVRAYNTGDTSTDEYGRTTFVKGENYKTVNAVVRILPGSETYVFRQLSNLQNNPAVYDFNNDGTDYEILRVYGAITSIGEVLEKKNYSTVDVEIRGIVKKEEI